MNLKLTQHMKDSDVPDVVINCAGFAHPGYFDEVSDDSIRKMMDLNYFGIINVLKPIVPEFIKRKSGHIVNFSSMSGFLGLFGYSAYCGSKFAVIGFSESLKRELAIHGIKVSVVCPPGTETPGFDLENKLKPIEVKKVEEKAKVLTAEEVAKNTIKALPKQKFMINPSFDAKLAYYLNRYAPSVLETFYLKR